jgi:negative regulator of sigma E activity
VTFVTGTIARGRLRLVSRTREAFMRKVVLLAVAQAVILAVAAVVLLGIGSGYV